MMQILDVAIGLTLVFFLFSVLVSTVQELLASLLNWRGRGWETAMQRWLNGGLHKVKNPIGERFRLSRRKDLPAASLAAAVLDHGAVTSLMKDDRLPSYAPSNAISDALIDELRKRANDDTPTAEGLRWAVAGLENQALREQLEPLLQQAGEDVAALRAEIARTYDQVMDRVSGQYKRFSQLVQIVLGLLVAVVFNLDAIYLTKALVASDSLRSDLVEMAQQAVNEPQGEEAPATGTDESIGAKGAAVTAAYQDIAALNLPIGAQATIAVYTDRVHALSFLRKIIIRIKSWENYVF